MSVAVIAALMLLLILWPGEHETSPTSLGEEVSAAESADNQLDANETPQSVPSLPPVQLLQPDPGLSQEQLFTLASNARRCFNIPRSQDELDDWLVQANRNDELPILIENVVNAFDSCQNVKVNYDYMTTFRLLAQQGHQAALWRFWHLRDEEVFRLKGIHKLDRDAIIAARQEFELTKYQLAEQHLLQGDERAMMRLMYAYRHLDPATGGQNYVRSLALANLVLNISDDQHNYRRADWHKQFMEQRMDSNEIEEAIEVAQQIAEEISR